MSTQDMTDLYEWYDRMADKYQNEADHAAGGCGEECMYCAQERAVEDEYDRWRDDRLDGLR